MLAVVDEIEARVPEFFDANVLTMNAGDLRNTLEDLEELGGAVQRTWESRNVRYETGPTSEPVARELLRGVRDAMHPDLACRFGPPEATDVSALLRSEYTEFSGASGAIRAHVRRRPGRPLLLLNALGLSIRIWSRFLQGTHDHQVILPVLSSCDVLDGGMTRTSSARQVAQDLRDLLLDLALPEVDVLAWCNGGRIGVELLRLAGASIGKLILLSPTFRGGITPGGRTSPYEDSLDKLFSLVASQPDRAAAVSAMLRRPQPAPDWQRLARKPVERAWQLFSLPRRTLDTAMVTPMAAPESLVHYVRRTYLDEAISAEPPVALPAERIVLIQGSHDSIVENAQTREWLEARAPGFTAYEVSGAGHYIHDLQYPYLAHLLHRTLVAGVPNSDVPARIRRIPNGGGESRARGR
jgi:pimeloyl-ACP methyl ester carboxylesterase